MSLQPTMKSGPSGEAAEAASKPSAAWPFLWALLAMVLTLGLQLPFASDRMDRPYDEFISGDCAASIQRHWLENGFFAMRGRPVKDWDLYAQDPPGPTYLRHPPMAQWLTFLGVKSWGYRPFGIRFASIVALAFSAAILTWICAIRLGAWAALASTCLLLSSPIIFFYGRMANTESFVFCFGLAGLLAMGRKPRRSFGLGLSFLTIAALCDWIGFVFYPGALLILWRRKASLKSMAVLTASGFINLFALFSVLVWWSGGQSLMDILRDGLEKSHEYEGSLSFWDAQGHHLLNMYGLLPSLVTGGALLLAVVQLLRKRESEIDRIMLGCALPGFAHVALFHGRAWDHEFWSFYLVGAVALAVATFVHRLGKHGLVFALLGIVAMSLEGSITINTRRYLTEINANKCITDPMNEEFGPETLIVVRKEVGGLLMHGKARIFDDVKDTMVVERLLEDFWVGKVPFRRLALWLDSDLAALRDTLVRLAIDRGGSLKQVAGIEFLVFER